MHANFSVACDNWEKLFVKTVVSFSALGSDTMSIKQKTTKPLGFL